LRKKLFIGLSGVFFYSQSTRITDNNSIGWFAFTGTFILGSKWQQGLFRTGINYQLHPNVQFRLGYARIEFFPYGDYPINSLGKDFTEHRVFQML
jgi:hypothetical protein